MDQLRFLLIILIFCSFKVTINGQSSPTSVSSVDWEYKQIESKMRDYQERVRSYIIFVQNQLNNTITVIGSTANLATVATTLKTSVSTLGNLATLSSYDYELDNITCDNIAVKTNSIAKDNLRISTISSNVAINGSKVTVEQVNIASQLALYHSNLSNDKRIALQNCTNSLAKLADMFTQYTILLANSIVRYNLLYVQLLTTKSQYCTGCVTNFKASDTKNIGIIDNDINQIQSTLNEIENWIVNASKMIVSKVNSVNPTFKNSTSLYRMAVNLDNIANLVQGFIQLSTLEFINETSNCDDNNWKIALVQYKIYFYGQESNEAILNSTYLLINQAVTEAYYSIDKNIMTKKQQETCREIFDICRTIIEYYRQYIMVLQVAIYTKLPPVVNDLKNIQLSACDCSGSTTVSTVSSSTSTTPTTSRFLMISCKMCVEFLFNN